MKQLWIRLLEWLWCRLGKHKPKYVWCPGTPYSGYYYCLRCNKPLGELGFRQRRLP